MDAIDFIEADPLASQVLDLLCLELLSWNGVRRTDQRSQVQFKCGADAWDRSTRRIDRPHRGLRQGRPFASGGSRADGGIGWPLRSAQHLIPSTLAFAER